MFNIPTITKNLLIINIIAFLASIVLQAGFYINEIFSLHMFLSPSFRFYQLFTYMFLHAGWTHLFFNMFALWMFGGVLERAWGAKRFLLFYIICGVGAGLFQEVALLAKFYMISSVSYPSIGWTELLEVAKNQAAEFNAWRTVGASGAIYGILLAFGMTFPEERIFIFPLPVPIKAKWFVMFYAAVELYFALTSPGDGVAHLAHLGGMVFGFFLIRYWNRHSGYGYGRYGVNTFFDNMRSSWENRSGKRFAGRKNNSASQKRESNPDWEYNMRKKAEQAEIDRILDKIRRNGYDSLSKEEKQKLFDNSNRR